MMPADPPEYRAPLRLADPTRRLSRNPGTFAGLAYWARAGIRPVGVRIMVPPEPDPCILLAIPIGEAITMSAEIFWPPAFSGLSGPWSIDSRRRAAEWMARSLARAVGRIVRDALAAGLAVDFEPMASPDRIVAAADELRHALADVGTGQGPAEHPLGAASAASAEDDFAQGVAYFRAMVEDAGRMALEAPEDEPEGD